MLVVPGPTIIYRVVPQDSKAATCFKLGNGMSVHNKIRGKDKFQRREFPLYVYYWPLLMDLLEFKGL